MTAPARPAPPSSSITASSSGSSPPSTASPRAQRFLLGDRIQRTALDVLESLRRPWRTIDILMLTSAVLSCPPGGEPGGSPDEDTTRPVGFTDEVARFIETEMRPASAAFVIPSPIRRDESVTAVLEVSALGTTPAEIQRGLENALDRSTPGASAKILSSPGS